MSCLPCRGRPPRTAQHPLRPRAYWSTAASVVKRGTAHGHYVDTAPTKALATVDLMSLFDAPSAARRARRTLRRRRGDLVPTSRRLAEAQRRVGAGPAAVRFSTEDVEADVVRERVVRHDVAGGAWRENRNWGPMWSSASARPPISKTAWRSGCSVSGARAAPRCTSGRQARHMSQDTTPALVEVLGRSGDQIGRRALEDVTEGGQHQQDSRSEVSETRR